MTLSIYCPKTHMLVYVPSDTTITRVEIDDLCINIWRAPIQPGAAALLTSCYLFQQTQFNVTVKP
jgi:hypothetical protein